MFYNKLGGKWLFGDKLPPEAIFEMLVMENSKSQNYDFSIA